MFQTKVVEKLEIHILCSILFFFENRAVYEVMCTHGKNTQPIFAFFHNMCEISWHAENIAVKMKHTSFFYPLFLYVRKTY
jgi:hypothetical protein